MGTGWKVECAEVSLSVLFCTLSAFNLIQIILEYLRSYEFKEVSLVLLFLGLQGKLSWNVTSYRPPPWRFCFMITLPDPRATSLVEKNLSQI